MITIQKPQFAYNALEPYFDARTMEIHTEKHHQTYADKLNALVEANAELHDKTLEEYLTNSSNASYGKQLLNMAGGVANHDFFWSILSPEFDQLVPEIFQPFIPQFTDAATKLFGSGWIWLVGATRESPMRVISTPNQDSPLSQGLVPLLGLDVWEHAYYLRYQNRRPDYISAFWHVVNWKQVETLYKIHT